MTSAPERGDSSPAMKAFRYHSTNCFLVPSNVGGKVLAVDAGWPGTLLEYARHMKTVGCRLQDIAWAIVTHFHMDHAGLIGEFLFRGITCYVFENQLGVIDSMEKTIRKSHPDYRPIDQARLQHMSTRDSVKQLASIGIQGKVIVTDYHSPDSITFITGEGEAVVGDLPPASQLMRGDLAAQRNWDAVRQAGGRKIYPSHAAAFELGNA